MYVAYRLNCLLSVGKKATKGYCISDKTGVFVKMYCMYEYVCKCMFNFANSISSRSNITICEDDCPGIGSSDVCLKRTASCASVSSSVSLSEDDASPSSPLDSSGIQIMYFKER